MDASSSAHPHCAFLPGHLLPPPAGNRLVGSDLEQHSYPDALTHFWIRICAGGDPAFSLDPPLPGETRAARRQQCCFAVLHFLDFCTKPWTANVCFMHMQRGHRHRLEKTKTKQQKTDLVNLATIIQEVCGRAANKIQTFCLLGLCLHNNTVLPLGIWACLIGRRCSACLLKGKGCWESHALIL